MDFRILGPLEVWDGDRRVEIAGVKPRAVLAVLILQANEVVSRDQLIEALWGASAPRTVAGSLHNHVSRLRKAIGSDVLITQAWGYILRINPERIDLHQFERLVAKAEPLPARERSAGLAEALSLWRGAAFADLACEPALADEAARLDELRLTVHEARIDADLELGRNAGMIAELETLIVKCPLREHLRWQLILALYRAGRQAEALEVYRQTRRLLADELGLEPSPALRELERSILCHDPTLAATHAVVIPATSARGERWPRRRWLLGGLVGALMLASGAATSVALVRAAAGPTSALPTTSTVIVTEADDGESSASAATAVVVARPVPTPPATVATSSATVSTRSRGMPKSATHGEGTTTSSAATAETPRTVPKPATHPEGTTTSRATTAETPRTAPKPATSPKGTTTSKTVTGPTTQPDATPTQPDVTPTQMITISDDFASGPTSPPLWVSDTLGAGVRMSQVDGHLEMTMAAEATPDQTWNAIAGHYSTACAFTGDFDVSVEYTLLNWPAANSAVIALDVSFVDDVVNLVRKSLPNGGQELYAFGAPSDEYREAATDDMAGGFRMTRVGDVITAFYRENGQWVKFASTNRAGAVRLRPTLYANGADFAHKDVAIAFDNFSVRFRRVVRLQHLIRGVAPHTARGPAAAIASPASAANFSKFARKRSASSRAFAS